MSGYFSSYPSSEGSERTRRDTADSDAAWTPLVKTVFENYYTLKRSARSTTWGQDSRNKQTAKRNKYFQHATHSSGLTQKDSITVRGRNCQRGTYFKLRCGQIVRAIWFATGPGDRTLVHAVKVVRPEDTWMGELLSRQVFASLTCRTVEIEEIDRPITVKYEPVNDTLWRTSGGQQPKQPKDHFWFNLQYDERSSFVKVDEVFLDPFGVAPDYCRICTHNERMADEKDGYFTSGTFWKNGVQYVKDDGVFLTPNTFEVKRHLCELFEEHGGPENPCPLRFTEAYRFDGEQVFKGDNSAVKEPLQVGIIVGFKKKSLIVRPLLRVWNVCDSLEEVIKSEMNEVLWTNESETVSPLNVEGKCVVMAKSKITSTTIDEWQREGRDRFFFKRSFSFRTGDFCALPPEACHYNPPPASLAASRYPDLRCPPLKTMDVFSGCGGLSAGLAMSGCAAVKWGIEIDPMAARAFQKNHPNSRVYNTDANEFLRELMQSDENSNLPTRGEVEFICSGPPCLGFSRLNRHQDTRRAEHQRSFFPVTLSYIDYYRPKYFLIENVADLTSHSAGDFLNKICDVIVGMNYQFRIGIFQCGNYGVPQDRKRTFILGTSMAEKLPFFPDATHVFASQKTTSQFATTSRTQMSSSPFRNIVAQEVFSDLPRIHSGGEDTPMTYLREPSGNFQKEMRLCRDGKSFRCIVNNHISKPLTILVKARISLIPSRPGADWRDLPNTIWKFPSGDLTEPINYDFVDGFSDGELQFKGVCSCMVGPKMRCDRATYMQINTIIPWAMVHTARSNGKWRACYGRVTNDSYFGTITCDIGPEKVQGRVLHPDSCQKRLLSVRECARAMGMKDSFVLVGDFKDMYKQVGNAVPPPVSKAIGREITLALGVQ